MTMASRHIMTEPKMALIRPPGVPAAGVDMVNTLRLRPPTPCATSDHRIRARAARARAVTTKQKPTKMALAARRRPIRAAERAISDPRLVAQHEARQGQHRE